jgi:hypothetical protein
LARSRRQARYSRQCSSCCSASLYTGTSSHMLPDHCYMLKASAASTQQFQMYQHCFCCESVQLWCTPPCGCDAAQSARARVRCCSAAASSATAAAAKACMHPSSRHSGAGSSNSSLQLPSGSWSSRSTLQLVPGDTAS